MWMFIHPFCDFLNTHDLASLLSQLLLSRQYLIASYRIKTTEFINKHFTSQPLLFIFPAYFLKYVYWNSSSISSRPFTHRSWNLLSVIVLLLSSFLSLYSIQTLVHDYSHLFSCKYPLLLHPFLLPLYSFGKITVYKSKQLLFSPPLPWIVQNWREDYTTGKVDTNKGWQSHCWSRHPIEANNLISLLLHFSKDYPYILHTTQTSDLPSFLTLRSFIFVTHKKKSV